VFRIKLPSVMPVSLPSLKTFFIPIANRSLQQISAILIQIIVAAVTRIAIDRIAIIIITERLQADSILLQALPVPLLEAPLIHAAHLLQILLTLLPLALPLVVAPAKIVLTLTP